MVELTKNAIEKIQALHQTVDIHFPLIEAVIQKKQRGWVFVDNPDNPTSVMVVTNFGFMQTFGAQQSERFNADTADFFTRRDPQKPSYLLWYSPPPHWQNIMDKSPDQVRRRERMRFNFNKQRADYLGRPLECPSGFELSLLDDGLIEKTDGFKLNIGSRYWASVDDFLNNGFGVCVIKDGEIASLCYSACIVNGLAEIDVVTQAEYRGQGLAVAATRFFIRECMGRGMEPTWDCFVNNTASMNLAEKLGFVQASGYLFYSFNIPILFTGPV
jgi:GNAT superfamily N-acetyltransferase